MQRSLWDSRNCKKLPGAGVGLDVVVAPGSGVGLGVIVGSIVTFLGSVNIQKQLILKNTAWFIYQQQ